MEVRRNSNIPLSIYHFYINQKIAKSPKKLVKKLKISIETFLKLFFNQNMDFYENIEFLKNMEFWKKNRFLAKYGFLTKILTFDKNIGFWQEYWFLRKILIFEKNIDFFLFYLLDKFYLLFHLLEITNFLPTFLSFRKFVIQTLYLLELGGFSFCHLIEVGHLLILTFRASPAFEILIKK